MVRAQRDNNNNDCDDAAAGGFDSSTEYKITYYKDSSAPKAPNASSGEKGCFIFDELTQISSLGVEDMEEYKHIMVVGEQTMHEDATELAMPLTSRCQCSM